MSIAEEKRKKSLAEKTEAYKKQKAAIRNALSSIDSRNKNKIRFDDDFNVINTKNRKLNATEPKSKKPSLFQDDDDDNFDLSANFELKKQFEGIEGQKLFELQSRFKNDERFQIDSRFVENGEEEANQEEVEKITDDEKQRQLEILQSILGSSETEKPKRPEKAVVKSMLRYDPSQPSHLKFEKKQEEKEENKLNEKPLKNKKKLKETVKEVEPEIETVAVSKEKFYKVTDTLKQALQENTSFSLLGAFGRTVEENDTTENQEVSETISKPIKKFVDTENPFKYDSSDDEEETTADKEPTQNVNVSIGGWKETFFFRPDDERLKEGVDFIKSVLSKSGDDFSKTRHEIKRIVKAKIQRSLKQKDPFKKKLGGKKRKRKQYI